MMSDTQSRPGCQDQIDDSESNQSTSEIYDLPSSSTHAAGEDDKPRDLFITHKVDKMDTLAGLAIKYNVSVSDIKRCNGLLSDTAMFARDTLLIPTERLPVGLEYSAWAAMIITRHGRVANGAAARPPKGLLGITDPDGKNEAIEQLKRYYHMGSSSNLAGRAGVASRGDYDLPMDDAFANGSLELTNFGGDSPEEATQQMTIVLRDRDASGGAERVRRRRAGDSQDLPGDLPPFPNSTGRSSSVDRAATVRPSLAGAGSSKESFMQKLKRAASNPSLNASAHQLSAAAEGMLSQISENMRPGLKSLKNMLSSSKQASPPSQRQLNAKSD